MKWNTQCLDGFRFLLALWVVLGHFYIVAGGTKLLHIPGISKLLLSPTIAVDGFMVITGFLMTYHYMLRETKEPPTEWLTGIKFILRRLFRLYPVYVVALIAAFFLVTDLYGIRREILQFFTGDTLTPFGQTLRTETRDMWGLLVHLLFLHGLFPAYESSVLSVAWSLSLEMQFYVMFPLIFALLFVRGRFLVQLSFVAISTVVSVLLLRYALHGHQPAMLLFKLPLFLLGAMMAAVGLKRISWKAFAVCIALIVPFQKELTIAVIALLMGLLFLDLYRAKIGPAGKLMGALRHALSSKLAGIGADLSYSLYLIHMLILPFVLRFYMQFPWPKLQIAGAALLTFLAINAAVSFILYNIVEKPMIHIGKRVIERLAPRKTLVPARGATPGVK